MFKRDIKSLVESSDEEESISDGESEQVKERSQPFTGAETNMLLELVEDHKTIVISKKSDFGTIEKKKRAWEDIQTQFNSNSEVSQRTADQLKKKWENLKRIAKSNISKKARRHTDGGPRARMSSKINQKVTSIVSKSKKDQETVKISEPVIKQDSTLTECELEEHKARMKILSLSYEYEVERLKKIRLEQDCIRFEHEGKMKILALKVKIQENSENDRIFVHSIPNV